MFRWTRGGSEDRWHFPSRRGAHEWWGFEALDRDAELSFALRIAAGDPMDPRYSASLARESQPSASRPDRHILVRVVAYHKGRRLLAQSFRPAPDRFAASATSGAVRAGSARVTIEETAAGRSYHLEIEPGTRLRFDGPPGQSAASGPLQKPVWDLAPLGLKVSGILRIRDGGRSRDLPFYGRGVHDHGFSPTSPDPDIRAWAWGWAHAQEFAVAWRQVIGTNGKTETLLLVDRGNEPFIGETVRSRPFRTRYSLLGIPYRRHWRLDASPGAGLAVEKKWTLASSPLGMRFFTNVRFSVQDPAGRLRLVEGVGLSSVARPQRLRVPPLRWMTLAREFWTSHHS
ncbi:MAG: hypothetical protein ACE5HD_08060 [Acidobacteriota bacterium]